MVEIRFTVRSQRSTELTPKSEAIIPGNDNAREGPNLRSAERTMKNIIPQIEGELFLKVNRDKSQVAYVRDIKFLGYSFYIIKGEGRLRIHPKSVAKMKAKLKS